MIESGAKAEVNILTNLKFFLLYNKGEKMKKPILILILIFICTCCGGGGKSSEEAENPGWGLPNCDYYYIDINEYATVEPPEDMNIFVVIGQSNVSGIAELLPEDMNVFDNIYLLIDDSNHWIKAKNPFNSFSNISFLTPGLNFVYSFALELIKAYPDQSFGFIVNARGGSQINCWQKNNPCYECTMDRVLTVPYNIIGVLMHQGESDCNNLDWLENAADMIYNFRTDTGYSMPFVLGEIAQWNPDYTAFNERLTGLPLLISNIKIVQSNGLTGTDNAHFDHTSQIELGIRYFDLFYL